MVPIGATEQHGHHTPLMVDTAWASDVSEAVAQTEGVLVTPPLHFGWSPHHLAYPGGITLRAETLTQVALDVGESLISHGFRKIVFVNGNRVANLPPLQIAMAKLRFNTGAYVWIIDTHLIARKEVCEAAGNRQDASHHAGLVETAFMLHAHPELVKKDKLGRSKLKTLGLRQQFSDGSTARSERRFLSANRGRVLSADRRSWHLFQSGRGDGGDWPRGTGGDGQACGAVHRSSQEYQSRV